MEKFIPYEKLSKKEQQKINKEKRGTWANSIPLPGSHRTARHITGRERRFGRRIFQVCVLFLRVYS